MLRTVSIAELTLYDLEQRFELQEATDPDFFCEWQFDLPELTKTDRDRLKQVRLAYTNLERRSVLENTVKLAVVAPLLDLASFFFPPFYVETETPVEVTANDGETTLRGRLDVLVIRDRFWVLVIESKRAEFSLKVGIPQVLSYMLSDAIAQQTRYGWVTNGESFVFLKLVKDRIPQYGRSREFLLGQDAGLEKTLQIMKKLAEIVAL